MNRLYIALAAYVAIGALAWATLSDRRVRLVTLAILAMFAVKTWVRRKDAVHPDGEESTSGRDAACRVSRSKAVARDSPM